MHPKKFLRREPKPAAISEEEKLAHLERLGAVIAGKRKDAVDARKESGIERVWMACEEAYLGIDNMNRHEFAEARWAKPTSMEGPVTTNKLPDDDNRSNVFVRLTSRYVDHGVGKLCEILLPIDDKAFSFTATPVPDLIEAKKDERNVLHDDGTPLMKMPDAPEPGQPVGMPGQPEQPAGPVPIKVKDFAQETLDLANEKAKKAETRIYDWMVESRYPAECRKVAHDAGRIGVGVLKGPFPELRDGRAVKKTDKGIVLEIKQSVSPAMKWIDPWNFFPDPACGEDIHNGDHVFERDYLSEKQLRKLKDSDDYLGTQIDKVIAEGPGKIYADGGSYSDKKSKKRYEIWYQYGTLKRTELAVANAQAIGDVPEDAQAINTIVAMVNDTVIKAVLNPLDSGSFPYRVMSWSRRPGHWAGVGIGESITAPQRMVNASTRALLNNAGLTAGPQIIIDQIGIVPADGSWKLTPNKIWYKTGESTAAKVSDAFYAVVIPSVQKEMAAIIEYAMRLAEESSGIPLVTQGQVGPTTPQTFGQAELQNNNSLTWLRSIGYRFDDMITEPMVGDLYEWLLLDPEVPEDEKGDFNINAHGSIAMVERAIQEQTVMQLLGASANPAYRINPPKLFALMLKGKRIDPREVQYSDEEFAKLPAQMPPIPIAVEQAKGQNAIQLQQVKDQTAVAIAQGHDQVIIAKTKEDTDRDRVYVEAEAERTQNEYDIRIEELRLRERLAMLDYSNRHQITLDQVKAKLADTSMRLSVQKELSAASLGVEVHKHHTAPAEATTPPTEPAGRAESGQSFAQ